MAIVLDCVDRFSIFLLTAVNQNIIKYAGRSVQVL